MRYKFNESELPEEVQEVLSREFGAKLDEACRALGIKNVQPQYRELWTPEKPRLGLCYPIAELVNDRLGELATPMTIPTRLGKHWWVNVSEEIPIDLAQDDDYDYSQGKKSFFMPTKDGMSKRARFLKEFIENC